MIDRDDMGPDDDPAASGPLHYLLFRFEGAAEELVPIEPALGRVRTRFGVRRSGLTSHMA